MQSFILSLSSLLWCFIWYPTIKPLFELPSIVYGFFLWGETVSCLKGLQSRRLPSYWCRGVLPSSLLDQSLTSLLFYSWGHFTERSLTTSPQRFAKRYSSGSWGGWKGWWGPVRGFWRKEDMHLDSVTVTHMHSHTSLFSTAVGASGFITRYGKGKQSNRKHWEDHSMFKNWYIILLSVSPFGCKIFLMSLHFQFLSVCSLTVHVVGGSELCLTNIFKAH